MATETKPVTLTSLMSSAADLATDSASKVTSGILVPWYATAVAAGEAGLVDKERAAELVREASQYPPVQASKGVLARLVETAKKARSFSTAPKQGGTGKAASA